MYQNKYNKKEKRHSNRSTSNRNEVLGKRRSRVECRVRLAVKRNITRLNHLEDAVCPMRTESAALELLAMLVAE